MNPIYKSTIAGALLTSLLVAAPAASAQVGPADGALPGFASMDRPDGQTKVSLAFAYLFFDDGIFGNDLSGQRVDLHGQYVHPELGVGGYGVLNYGRIATDDDSEGSLGNIEIGGLYEVRGSVPVVLRGGITLPTADDDEIAPLFSSFARLTDAFVNVPDSTWIRLAASPLLRSGQLVFRADVGLDVPIDEPSGDVFLETDLDPLARVNVGGGVDTGEFAVLGELVNVATLGDVEDEADRFIHAVTLTARYTGSDAVQPGLSVMVPVDDDLNDFLEAALILSADFPIATGGRTGAPH